MICPNEFVMFQVVSSKLLPEKILISIGPPNPPMALAEPFNTADCPLQMVTSGPAFTVGAGLTKTVIWSVEVQVPDVAVSVYVVVTVGVAVGFNIVVELNVAPGDQT